MTNFKTTRTFAVAAAALMLAAGPALAVTVTNQSDKAMSLTVDLGDNEPKTDVAPGATAKVDCPEGCELRVPTFSYGLAATSGDKVLIGKDGVLVHEGQTAAKEARNDKDGKAGKTAVD